MRELELAEKLEMLMSLAMEDREGPPEANRVLPPRLHTLEKPVLCVRSTFAFCAGTAVQCASCAS